MNVMIEYILIEVRIEVHFYFDLCNVTVLISVNSGFSVPHLSPHPASLRAPRISVPHVSLYPTSIKSVPPQRTYPPAYVPPSVCTPRPPPPPSVRSLGIFYVFNKIFTTITEEKKSKEKNYRL